LISIENLESAVALTKVGNFSGLDDVVSVRFTKSKLMKLHYELSSQQYKISPLKKKVQCNFGNGKHSVGLSSFKDKIVQAALKLKLEPLLEKNFRKSSFGFRPKLNCHNALRALKKKAQKGTWIVNLDLSNSLDVRQHTLLLQKIGAYCDQATVDLVKKFLNAGYFDNCYLSDFIKRSRQKLPPAGAITPLLINTYLHTLDVFFLKMCCYRNEKKNRNVINIWLFLMLLWLLLLNF
jgi:retron-type reverse transcriptase